MLARKILITAEIDCSTLPTLIKRANFEKLVSLAEIEKNANRKASSILKAASKSANETIEQANIERDEWVNAGYDAGLKKAHLEMAARMTELAASSSQFMRGVESRLVDIVGDSIAEIISGFDDRTLVTETVKRAASSFRYSGSVTLWVAPGIHDQLEVGICELVAPAALIIKPDEQLQGGQCRLDNGQIVVVGDTKTQVDAVKTALIKSLENSTYTNCH